MLSIEQKHIAFEKSAVTDESALLRFEGVDGFDVYNCSIPFEVENKTYIFGRVEKRTEWARSWVRLFEKVGVDHYSLLPDSMIYQMEDPYIAKIGNDLVLGGTHVRYTRGEIETYYGYFYKGQDMHDLRYFTTGPDYMKDIRLVPLSDGRIGVFSRPRSEKIEKKYGSGSVVGFTVVDDLLKLDAKVIENAPIIEGLFGKGEWGGCNQCYPLSNGKIGVIGHQSYTRLENGKKLLVYLNTAFVFDPETHQATEPEIIASRKSYPMASAKIPELVDCAFTSGIVPRKDGRMDLYSGLGDTCEGRVVIDNPFAAHGDILR